MILVNITAIIIGQIGFGNICFSTFPFNGHAGLFLLLLLLLLKAAFVFIGFRWLFVIAAARYGSVMKMIVGSRDILETSRRGASFQ